LSTSAHQLFEIEWSGELFALFGLSRPWGSHQKFSLNNENEMVLEQLGQFDEIHRE